MIVSSRFLFLCLLLGAVCFSPVAVGAAPGLKFALAVSALMAFAVYAFGYAPSLRLKQVALVLLSICFAVTLFDLSTRPLFYYLFEVRPTERLIYNWPLLPRLQRYDGGATLEWETYGDLAAMSGHKDWREKKHVRFVTDAYGFRNEPTANGAESRPLDVIVLGDSFGVAGGTSQEETLSSLLARDYGLSVYNLSISRESPQQEYANLFVEGHRLKTRAGTCVLWLIFTGNDLDDPYYPELFDPQPQTPGLRARLVDSIKDFRARSPVQRMMTRGGAGIVLERAFADGRPVLFYAPYAERRARTAEEISRHPNFENLKMTLSAMEKLAGEKGLTIEVSLVPSKEEVYSWALDGATPWSTATEPSGFSLVMRELCAQHGFRFLDLKLALVEASARVFKESGALLWWRDDTHWNAEGQRVAAAAVEESLVSNRIMPLRLNPRATASVDVTK